MGKLKVGMFGDAEFSDDERFRYALRRWWAPQRAAVTWIMLNPSTADERVLDPTVRRVRSFSQYWGFGAFTVLNLFALRATDPQVLARVLRDGRDADGVGVDNDRAIARGIRNAAAVICAWGDIPRSTLKLAGGVRRDVEVLEMLREMEVETFSLGTTLHGQPRHPLYVPGNQHMEVFAGT